MSMIFWFSGTGNSLYAAKRLSAGLDDMALYPISSGVPSKQVGGAGEKIGFVFPSYYGNLPRIVRGFVEKLNVDPDTYIFAVVTMGGLGQFSVAALEAALNAKGLRLDYGRGIGMPANYVLNYNPADTEKSGAKLSKADKRLSIAASDIASGVKSVRKINFTANNLYRNIESLDARFSAEESCTGCGQCAKICPVSNIRMDNGKPRWLGHCEHCVACISWCPTRAIQYTNRTQKRRRYRNPEIKVNELLTVKRD